MATSTDEQFAQELRDDGIPPELDETLACKVQEIVRFDFEVACNGFSSLYDQIILPADWPHYEKLLDEIGATTYNKHLRQAREIYFGDAKLPTTHEEWTAFKSVIWSDPEGPLSRQFDDIAEKAEEAFYSDQILQKIGAYVRKRLHSKSMPNETTEQ